MIPHVAVVVAEPHPAILQAVRGVLKNYPLQVQAADFVKQCGAAFLEVVHVEQSGFYVYEWFQGALALNQWPRTKNLTMQPKQIECSEASRAMTM